MFKRLSKLRRIGKKKEKRSSAKGIPNGAPEVSDDQASEKDSIAEISNGVSTVRNGPCDKAAIDSCNNETNGDCDVINTIPVAGSSDGSISDASSEDEDFSIPIEDLKGIYTKKHADEDRLFREEMKSIPTYVARHPPGCEYAKLPQNREKNRYKNIVTSDKARVVLQRIEDQPFSDYINASYIDGYTKKRKFIATQGPKPKTVNDFWRMVWEQGCKVIVMVTDFRENGKVKCERYFPESGSEQYGNIYVECKQVTCYGGYHQRTLAVRYEEGEVFENETEDEEHSSETAKEVRHVTHFQCKSWPDHGVPKTTSAIFRLHRNMLKSQPPDCEAPILVHCSAGVGRTGTLIGLDILIDELAEEGRVNIHDAVVEMRKQRSEMVQSMDQYVLLHKLILEHHYFGETDQTVAEFDEHVAKMIEVNEETGKSGFESELKLLTFVPPQNARFGTGSLLQNELNNRDEKVIPYEHSQVFIRMRPTEMRPPYVNASPLQGYDDTVNLMAAQDPLPTNLEDFWRVIADNNVTCIVMLSLVTTEEAEYCPRYWPSKDVLEFGDITIKNEESVNHEHFTETKLTLLTDDREKMTRSVTHLHCDKWLVDESPTEHCDAIMLDLIANVDKQREHRENNARTKVLVHCSDGAGRTGVFCAIVNLIQRLKCENKIDVFRTVKDLRDCRPCMVKTAEEYKLCHQAISKYLQYFDIHSNGR